MAPYSLSAIIQASQTPCDPKMIRLMLSLGLLGIKCQRLPCSRWVHRNHAPRVYITSFFESILDVMAPRDWNLNHFIFFYSRFFFFFHFLFCFYLSCFGEFCKAFFAFYCLLWRSRNVLLAPWVYNGRIKFFLAISQNQQAPFCHESPPRTRRDRSWRLRGRTYGNTSLMLRIVRRVLVLRRVFKTCVRAAGDL